jgi:hypothetical protein
VWDPSFTAKSPHFWPIAEAAALFAQHRDWPSVEEYARLGAPIRFVEQPPRPRRRPPLDPSSLYDARIVRGEVPTRARSWHDFLNALVWATFPRSKASLHARQHRAIAARIAPGARRLPPTRTRELDCLALLDEGGVLLAGDRAVVFGHALYETLATTGRAVNGASLRVGGASLAEIDAAFAAALDDAARFLDPDEVVRYPVR